MTILVGACLEVKRESIKLLRDSRNISPTPDTRFIEPEPTPFPTQILEPTPIFTPTFTTTPVFTPFPTPTPIIDDGTTVHTPEPTPTPTPALIITPTPTPTINDGTTNQPTPSPTPSPTPEPTPTPDPGSASDITPPKISNIFTIIIDAYSVNINWRTDEPANGQIEFFTTPCPDLNNCLTQRVPNLTTSNVIFISGLFPSTTYYYVIRVWDAAGNLAVSPQQSFITAIEITPTPTPTSNEGTISQPTPTPTPDPAGTQGGAGY